MFPCQVVDAESRSYYGYYAIDSGAFVSARALLSGNSHMRIGAKPTGNSAETGVSWTFKM
jgi:hypothetical protein